MEKVVEAKGTKEYENTTRTLENKAKMKPMEVVRDKQRLLDFCNPFHKFSYIADACNIELM